MRLRLLGSRLGSDSLEEWVKFETEGYPQDVDVPDYRRVGINYTGTFAGPGQVLNNAQIPPAIIKNLAGEDWIVHRMREPLAEVEHLLQRTKDSDGGTLAIGGASNLIPILQGKMYPGMVCQEVTGAIPDNSLVNIQSVVRSRILDLTIKLEPLVGDDDDTSDSHDRSESINQIAHSIIYGNVTIAANVHGDVALTVQTNDTGSLVAALTGMGLKERDAQELATIMAGEKPVAGSSLGRRAMDWIASNINDAGRQVMVNLLSDLASKFYG